MLPFCGACRNQVVRKPALFAEGTEARRDTVFSSRCAHGAAAEHMAERDVGSAVFAYFDHVRQAVFMSPRLG
jgi:hypothetical protein